MKQRSSVTTLSRPISYLSPIGTMLAPQLLAVIYLLCSAGGEAAAASDDVMQDMRIPHGVTLTKEDTYVCTTGASSPSQVPGSWLISPSCPLSSEAAH